MRPRVVPLLAMSLLACVRSAQSGVALEPVLPFEALGEGAGVSMVRATLSPSETFRFEASPCQEVLVFVEKGVVRAGLTWLETGRAARFRASTVLQAMSEDGARIFAVAALSESARFETVDWTNAPDAPECARPEAVIVESDPGRSGPFVHADGRLKVMIYLEGAADSPAVASLGTLEGDATLGVPEHVHEVSAEVLWIQDGSGTMRVGDETRLIKPGTFVYVPPRTVHGFVPDGTRPLFAYQVYMPSGPEQRFR
jgi:mannose-6-phosphate isomerase-like protein (cupin superfamily)